MLTLKRNGRDDCDGTEDTILFTVATVATVAHLLILVKIAIMGQAYKSILLCVRRASSGSHM